MNVEASAPPSGSISKTFASDAARLVGDRLGRLLGSPVEAAPAEPAAAPEGAGMLLAGRIGGRGRLVLFVEEALLEAAAGALLGTSAATLDAAAPIFRSVAAELLDAFAAASAAGGPAASAEIDDLRAAATPPPATGRRMLFRVSALQASALVSLDFESESPEGSRPSEVLLELELPFVVTLGSVEMELQQIQQLDAGAVLPLGRAAEGPVSLVVGGRVVARGELVVVDGCFGIRVETVETAERRLTTLARI